jgi:hypothetical protein
MANVPTRDYPVLWDLVKTPTLDALSKIRFYQQLRKKNAASLDAIMGVERSGYKSLFVRPGTAQRGAMYSYADLEGLNDLATAIAENPVSSQRLSISAVESSPKTARNIALPDVAMIPLVLADRYASKRAGKLDENVLVELFRDQENYILQQDLQADIVVPILNARFAGGRRFGEFSIIRITSNLRDSLSGLKYVSPSDLRALQAAEYALLIKDVPVLAEGYGSYFAAELDEATSNLILRFFEAVTIVAPGPATYAQITVLPQGWLASYEKKWKGAYSFLVLNYSERLWGQPDRPYDIDHRKTTLACRYSKALITCHPSIRVATRRLAAAWERGNDEDAILDLCIGLEALLGSGFGETVHRLCLRAAAMLSGVGWGPSDQVYDIIKDIYSYRSRVVHGVPGPHKKEELTLNGQMIHASRVATAALASLIELALTSEKFDPQKVDQKYIFAALDARTSASGRL